MERQINVYLASVTERTWDWQTAFPRTSADNHSPMKLNFRRVNSDQMYLELYAFGKATSLLRPLSYLWNTEWGLMCVLFLKFFGSFLYSLYSVFSCSVDCKMTCVFMFLFRFSELFLGKAFKIIILKKMLTRMTCKEMDTINTPAIHVPLTASHAEIHTISTAALDTNHCIFHPVTESRLSLLLALPLSLNILW